MASLTLEEIAKRAGVSRSTVSRVVNKHPSVRKEVRRRVLDIIAETGYQPNVAARSLASQQSRVIGLVIPRNVHTVFTDPYFPRLTQGVAQACNLYDYTLSLFLLHTADDERRMIPRIAQRGFLDGVLVQSTFNGDSVIPSLQEGDVPFVVIGSPFISDVSFIDVDNITAAYNAVVHLIRLGHRKIATITGALNTKAGEHRVQGYRNALLARGLEVDETLIVEADFTESGGYYAARQLLLKKLDAIFVASDMMAIGALRAISEAGLKVPEDIALVGFDDLPPARQAIPALTTVRQPIRRLGEKAVETLLDIIDNGDEPPRRIIFETELIIRNSCGSTVAIR